MQQPFIMSCKQSLLSVLSLCFSVVQRSDSDVQKIYCVQTPHSVFKTVYSIVETPHSVIETFGSIVATLDNYTEALYNMF